MQSTDPCDAIVLQALKDAPFDGWGVDALRRAAERLGHSPRMADALFPEGARSAATHAARIFDRQMKTQLEGLDITKLKIRERVAKAVMTRLQLMAPYRAGIRVLAARPDLRHLWASADVIWQWAGDTATDYNRYTKRALLSGVMGATLLFWFQDNSPRYAATEAFLHRRIENVLTIGKLLGRKKQAA